MSQVGLPASTSGLSISDVEVIATVGPAIGVVVTVLRLVLRYKHSGLWWDDGFAFLSAIHIIIACAGGWVHFMAPDRLSRTTRIATYYVFSEAFHGTIWLARLSILFSVIRITPDLAVKRFLYWAAVAFTVVWAFLFAQLFWVCVPEPNWTDLPSPQCTLSLQAPVCQLITDILSDSLLIIVPVRMLMGSYLERRMKIRLASIFSASILTTVVSLVHAVYILKIGGVDELIAGVVEGSVSLIVCNLTVVVTALHRTCGSGRQFSSARKGFKATTLKFSSSKSGPTSQPSSALQNIEMTHQDFLNLSRSHTRSSRYDAESTFPIDHSGDKVVLGDEDTKTKEVEVGIFALPTR